MNLVSLKNKFYTIEEHFSGSISHEKHIIVEGVAYFAGINESKFSVFLQRELAKKPDVIIAEANEFFSKHNILDWTYVVPSGLDTQLLRESLKFHGFVFEEASTAMYLHFEGKVFKQNQVLLTIAPVYFSNNLWLEVLQAGFESNNLTTNQYSKALGRAQAKGVNMQHFLGSVDNKPVATLTLTFLNDSVRIDNVATCPNFQGLGYASKMLQFGLELAQNKNCKYGFLDASAKGLGIYKRFGFSEIFQYNCYCKDSEI